MKDYNERVSIPSQFRVNPHFSEAEFATFISPVPQTSDWFALRREGIGSSDVPGILDISSFTNPIAIWSEKTGKEESYFGGTVYTWFGSFFESYIREYIEKTEHIEIIDGAILGQLKWNHWPIARANIDGVCTNDGVIEEIKTSASEWKDIPNDYYAQVQHQLMVCGAEQARIRQFIVPVDRKYIKVLYDMIMNKDELNKDEILDLMSTWLLTVGKIVTWPIKRDDNFIESLYKKEFEFWRCVENGEEPPVGISEIDIEIDPDSEVGAAFDRLVKLTVNNESFKPSLNAEKAAKDELKRLLDLEVALMPEKPKRAKFGANYATLVSSSRGDSWRFYIN